MQTQNAGRSTTRKSVFWPFMKDRATRRAVLRMSDRAINRAAQLVGPLLIVADGTLRSLRTIDHGEE
jgi:hypothetical protein